MGDAVAPFRQVQFQLARAVGFDVEARGAVDFAHFDAAQEFLGGLHFELSLLVEFGGQGEPARGRVHPHFLVIVAIGGRPVRGVLVGARLDAHGQRSGEVAGQRGVLRGVIITLAVHGALHERISAYDPLELGLAKIHQTEAAPQLGGGGQGARLAQQNPVMAAEGRPHREAAQVNVVAELNAFGDLRAFVGVLRFAQLVHPRHEHAVRLGAFGGVAQIFGVQHDGRVPAHPIRVVW